MEPLNTILTNVYVYLGEVVIDGTSLIKIMSIRATSDPGQSYIPRPICYFILLIIFFTFLASFAGAQSVIVTAKNRTEAVIGADSMVSTGMGLSRKSTACKIFQFGNVFFARAGFGGNPATGFMVETVAAEACRNGGTISQKLTRFDRIIVERLKTEMEWFKKNRPDEFRVDHDGQGSFQFVFVGFENGSPLLMTRVYTARSGVGDSVSIEPVFKNDCPPDCPPDGINMNFGHKRIADNYLAQNRYFWDGRSLVDGVRFLINLTMAQQSDMVGPPISILRINSSGAEWIEQGLCPDIEKYWEQQPSNETRKAKPTKGASKTRKPRER